MNKKNFKLREGESYIPLIQLLKAVGIVYSGGEAQEIVASGLVKRNGEVELRKRAKIIDGDVIVFEDNEIIVKK